MAVKSRGILMTQAGGFTFGPLVAGEMGLSIVSTKNPT